MWNKNSWITNFLEYTFDFGSFRLDHGFMMIWNKLVISDINNLYPGLDWGESEITKVYIYIFFNLGVFLIQNYYFRENLKLYMVRLKNYP